jgi:hypothetical protein
MDRSLSLHYRLGAKAFLRVAQVRDRVLSGL